MFAFFAQTIFIQMLTTGLIRVLRRIQVDRLRVALCADKFPSRFTQCQCFVFKLPFDDFSVRNKCPVLPG
jgi:hypothetical protein